MVKYCFPHDVRHKCRHGSVYSDQVILEVYGMRITGGEGKVLGVVDSWTPGIQDSAGPSACRI